MVVKVVVTRRGLRGPGAFRWGPPRPPPGRSRDPTAEGEWSDRDGGRGYRGAVGWKSGSGAHRISFTWALRYQSFARDPLIAADAIKDDVAPVRPLAPVASVRHFEARSIGRQRNRGLDSLASVVHFLWDNKEDP